MPLVNEHPILERKHFKRNPSTKMVDMSSTNLLTNEDRKSLQVMTESPLVSQCNIDTNNRCLNDNESVRSMSISSEIIRIEQADELRQQKTEEKKSGKFNKLATQIQVRLNLFRILTFLSEFGIRFINLVEFIVAVLGNQSLGSADCQYLRMAHQMCQLNFVNSLQQNLLLDQ